MPSIQLEDYRVLVDGVEYVRKQKPSKVYIVAANRGHTFVGELEVLRDEVSTEVVLTNASVIRRWGTVDGLGELAEKGPLPAGAPNGPTVLDPCPGCVRIPITSVVHMMECEAAAWK